MKQTNQDTTHKAKLTFLGTGTSQGVPIIACNCAVCTSIQKEDKRLRSSAFVEYIDLKILIDAGPDFRTQMLNNSISDIDAILLTHNHKDHTGGLDDIRSLNYSNKKSLTIYCEEYVLKSLKEEYSYAFAKDKYPGSPEWQIKLIDNQNFIVEKNDSKNNLTWVHNEGYYYLRKDGSIYKLRENEIITKAKREKDCAVSPGEKKSITPEVEISKQGAVIIPIRGYHDKLPVLGYRFGNIAYITDMNYIGDEELKKLRGLDHLTLNTVGYKVHHSHFNLDQALELANKIAAKNTWLTHLSHTFPRHNDFCRELENLCKSRGINSRVQAAFDGLSIEG